MREPMEQSVRPTLAEILGLLALPDEGRLLAFGAPTSDYALGIAAERPDGLVIVCDTTYETTRTVSDRALAERLHNIIVGDTHAGPSVDRALYVGPLRDLGRSDFNAMRTAMLPDGFGIFIEPGNDPAPAVETLRERGYRVIDVVESPVPDHIVVRAR